MKTHKYTEREIRLTAILYATREEVVRHVEKTGKLPGKIPLGGFPTAMNVILKRRGLEPVLSQKEELVLGAVHSELVLPGGGVILVEDRFPIYSVAPGQRIEICPEPRCRDWEE